MVRKYTGKQILKLSPHDVLRFKVRPNIWPPEVVKGKKTLFMKSFSVMTFDSAKEQAWYLCHCFTYQSALIEIYLCYFNFMVLDPERPFLNLTWGQRPQKTTYDISLDTFLWDKHNGITVEFVLAYSLTLMHKNWWWPHVISDDLNSSSKGHRCHFCLNLQ